jgi:hypothetical protein
MAARKLRPKHTEEIKLKIKGTQLINRLQNYALGNLTTKVFAKKEMTDGQVRAALGLLKKIVPDVSETKGEMEHSGAVAVGVTAIPDMTAEQWCRAHGIGETPKK